MTLREILIARFRAVDVPAPEAYADATLAEIEINGLVTVPREWMERIGRKIDEILATTDQLESALASTKPVK